MPFRSRTPRSVVGLDIEPGYIAAASVSVNGSLVVDHAAGVALDTGVVRDGEVADSEALTEALRQLFRANELDKRVRLGLANGRIVLRTLELPPITDRKELAAAVRFQAQDQLPMPIESAVIDFHTLGIGETPAGPRQRVVLVAARRDMVERLLVAVRAAGLRPEGIDLSAFAMIRALTRGSTAGTDATQPLLLLSVSGLTNLAVTNGSVCQFTRVVGSGLESMALELAERRAITLVEARRELETTGIGADRPAEASSAAQTVLTDGIRRIATEVRNSLDFHRTQDGGEPVGRALLTGAAVEVPGFAPALGAELGIPVEVGVVAGADRTDVPTGRVTVAAGLAAEEVTA